MSLSDDGTTPVRAAIGLGSNIGEKIATIDRAVALLDAAEGVRVVARSANYRTEPWGYRDQDWFVNACVLVETTLSARALLELCLATEQALGRRREIRWGPRTIDLDVLFYGDARIEEPGLSLPHPHILERAFVLAPLAEIAPDAVVHGERIADALARLGAEGVERMA
ncbi:2-amino-4-hydroxy-6-hydroxymethyldihydropteridine diphosphokinase [Segnochrobactrum spirostomi]|uniref:2-amino-4-hydroxy-6-hydroxymethyldihydropteridine pyrophosphokinase n=1 Tax=Segnochrobactrum spirostomi TaxID=2608987 RepID=A0A6A7Y0M4_9HYPH|nr:2-amino-4-hydroxy-6-hydroxymethyldihydropteridine diphosphokinase [Segnochrobactrum spirostomi]MQT11509.1 2-amino-4-hydroxy-6-hydroxymethyldihydropteridine diphosphokinase [Segnochrobactrum spirostomi]